LIHQVLVGIVVVLVFHPTLGTRTTAQSAKLKGKSMTFEKPTKLRLKIMGDPSTDISASFVKLPKSK